MSRHSLATAAAAVATLSVSPFAPILTAPARAQAGVPIEAAGPEGPLAGTFIDAGKGAPVAVIIPGSGPTDRDGNSPMGVTAGYLRLLAEGLAGKGVSSVRIDKRGMFGSRAAVKDPNSATIAGYAADTGAWIERVRAMTGASCVWVVGHSEGALVALAAVGSQAHVCGLVLVAGPGRPLGTIMREQFRANPANAPYLDSLNGLLDALEAGRTVPAADLPPVIAPMFPAGVQIYLIDVFRHDPAAMARAYKGPIMIVRGTRDIQVAQADADALRAAAPAATYLSIDGMNHVLKRVEGDDRAANLATYADASRPLAPGLVDGIAAFIKR
ncbi:alpha/beta fold hydrolase [Sphingomonas sp.]|uniref:alpha/beta hydrolase n=1 Tax=Sphingomonas sp. TaxID=28214 RepID=UPI001EB5532D|nr:alpha/beta fold hydrolase [Sphingomonas sp.]MBX3592938.1 alpha/beta fold hydrolase [Sphingomonas sp.]